MVFGLAFWVQANVQATFLRLCFLELPNGCFNGGYEKIKKKRERKELVINISNNRSTVSRAGIVSRNLSIWTYTFFSSSYML
uniref:Putative secreted protein n=1 Tax=Anopheles darlingi TaxID=43151 RepID=A0A2M4DIK6_ANODA